MFLGKGVADIKALLYSFEFVVGIVNRLVISDERFGSVYALDYFFILAYYLPAPHESHFVFL